jgi:hypothetical protein
MRQFELVIVGGGLASARAIKAYREAGARERWRFFRTTPYFRTMPEQTIRAFQDHGRIELRLESDLDQARHVFNQLYAAGVDYDDVVATLERERHREGRRLVQRAAERDR